MEYLPDHTRCTIAVVGLGYVGLPLAVEFSKIKNHVITKKAFERKIIGFDINEKRIKELLMAEDLTKEVTFKELKNLDNILFTYDEEKLTNADIFIITVPTPIDSDNNPDLYPLKKATEKIGTVISKKKKISSIKPIIIYESTVFPGMTEEVCVPILEEFSDLKYNIDFFCGYSPERINPGDKKRTLTDIVKITSGSNDKVAEFVDELYSSIIKSGTYKAPSIKVAEAAKVIENTQRDLNIALINEFAIIFKNLNINTSEILKAASTKWNFLNFKPGLVGGHCIGVDPYYLTFKSKQAGYVPELVLAGRKLNNHMPEYIANQLKTELVKREKKVSKSKVLILGFTFKENVPDIRNTKVIDLIKSITEKGITYDVVDPLVDPNIVLKQYNIQIENFINYDNKYDVILIAVPHNQFKVMDMYSWENNLLLEEGFIYDMPGIVPTEIDSIKF